MNKSAIIKMTFAGKNVQNPENWAKKAVFGHKITLLLLDISCLSKVLKDVKLKA
jgi:hypothetical protein